MNLTKAETLQLGGTTAWILFLVWKSSNSSCICHSTCTVM